jgi:hypothetical protein
MYATFTPYSDWFRCTPHLHHILSGLDVRHIYTIFSSQTIELALAASPLRGKSKDWLAQNQDNVPKLYDMSFGRLLF